MNDLDMLLSIIENPTRRKILEALVREPHYPLQLSRELQMSQQAIVKHLKVLEDNALVRSYEEESDRGGPARRLYVPVSKFTIIVDVGPGLFNVEILTPQEDGTEEERSRLDSFEAVSEADFAERIEEMRGEISRIESDLETLQQRRVALVEQKEQTLESARDFIENRIGDYRMRRIIYETVKRPSLSPEEIARELGLRDEFVSETLKMIGGKEARSNEQRR